MVSKRMFIVSTSTRGSRILERNLRAPPGVLVWFSTPKRLCSLLCVAQHTVSKNTKDKICTKSMITDYLVPLPMVPIVDH